MKLFENEGRKRETEGSFHINTQFAPQPVSLSRQFSHCAASMAFLTGEDQTKFRVYEVSRPDKPLSACDSLHSH
jgi:hypothetical protein